MLFPDLRQDHRSSLTGFAVHNFFLYESDYMRLVRGIDKFAMLYLRSIFQRNKGIHIASIPDYFLTPLLAINNPNPPINKSRARIKRVALMAEAADMPNVPSANT